MPCSSDSNSPLDELIAAYLEAVELGETPDQEELIAQHPEQADGLREFFTDLNQVNEVVAPLRLAAQFDETYVPQAATEVPQPPAKVIYFGEYELLEEIARGGMGVVYKAKQTSLNRIVALKMVLRGNLATPVDVARFRTEAEAAAQLDHRNIAPIYEVGEHDGLQYFTMKYIQGSSLSKVPVDSPHGEVTRLKDVAEAVHYAHQHGILHRDLKPGNILIDSDGVPYVVDFGLAKRLDDADLSLTNTGDVLGTPRYMAPEQAAGSKTLTTAADVYALGTILYERLTGTPLFAGNNYVEVLDSVRAGADHARLSAVSRTVGRDLYTILQKCLDPEPSRRFSSCQLLADELDRWLHGIPILSRHVNNAERGWRWMCRNPVVSGLSTAAVLLLCAVSVISTVAYLHVSKLSEDKDSLIASEQAQSQRAKAAEKDALSKAQLAEVQRALAERNADEARAKSYLANVRLAAARWDDDDLPSMTAALSAAGPRPREKDLRHWEWNYTRNLMNSEILTFTGHTGIVRCVVFSPDGKQIASGGDDQTVRIWDAVTGRELHSLRGHTYDILSLAFSPDGKRIASGSGNESLRVWDSESGELLSELDAKDHGVVSVAFSPDGKQLLTGGFDRTIRLWNVNDGRELSRYAGHEGIVRSICFNRQGTRIASGSDDGSLRIWDAQNTKPILTLEREPRQTTNGWRLSMHTVAFSPDGKRVVRGGSDRMIAVWDVESGKRLALGVGHAELVTSVSFSPDGNRILSSSTDHTIRLWDAATGEQLFSLKGQTDKVWSVAFSPNGRRIASGNANWKIAMWNFDAIDKPSWQQKLESSPATVPFVFENSLVHCVSFAPDSRRVVSSGTNGKIVVWDCVSGRNLLTIQSPMWNVTGVAFSPDGKRIVSSGWGRPTILWDVESGTAVHSFGPPGIEWEHAYWANRAAFDPSGKKLVGTRSDGAAVWDVDSGQELCRLKSPEGAACSLSFSPDGQQILGSCLKDIFLWDAGSGRQVSKLIGHDDLVNCLSFSPDGKRIASGGEDQTIRLWDATQVRELFQLNGHSARVTSLAFSPDGKRIVSSSYDQTVRLWNSETGEELLAIRGYTANVTSVAFSPDGMRIVIGSWDHTVKVLDGRPRSLAKTRINERVAQTTVQYLQQYTKSPDELAAAINQDQVIDDEVRRLALAFANQTTRNALLPGVRPP